MRVAMDKGIWQLGGSQVPSPFMHYIESEGAGCCFGSSLTSEYSADYIALNT